MPESENRVKHSQPGSLRYMQMSRVPLFVFVEGRKVDPYFYGGLCEVVSQANQIEYKLFRADELPGNPNGKSALMSMYDSLLSKSRLFHQFEGKTTAILFFVDKDLDDIEGTICPSAHFIYTNYYSVENYIFIHGDLAKAAAASASLRPSDIPDHWRDNTQWCLSVAQRWEKWVSLCYFCRIRGIARANYGRNSPINSPLGGPLDIDEYHRFLDDVRLQMGTSWSDFAARYLAVRKIIHKYFSAGRHDRIFRGTWYAILMAEDLRQAAPEAAQLGDRLPEVFTKVAVSTLDFTATWLDHLRQPLETLAQRLQRLND